VVSFRRCNKSGGYLLGVATSQGGIVRALQQVRVVLFRRCNKSGWYLLGVATGHIGGVVAGLGGVVEDETGLAVQHIPVSAIALAEGGSTTLFGKETVRRALVLAPFRRNGGRGRRLGVTILITGTTNRPVATVYALRVVALDQLGVVEQVVPARKVLALSLVAVPVLSAVVLITKPAIPGGFAVEGVVAGGGGGGRGGRGGVLRGAVDGVQARPVSAVHPSVVSAETEVGVKQVAPLTLSVGGTIVGGGGAPPVAGAVLRISHAMD